MKHLRFWFNLPVRTRLGVIAVVLLAAGGVLFALPIFDPMHHEFRHGSGIVRFAPIVFLLWLAWADLQNIPRRVWFIAPPVLIFCCIKPAAWLVVIPMTLFSLFVMPKRRKVNREQRAEDRKQGSRRR